jgi:CelD/BcsL family acetyltransferase involved in cellulose biosynthesis
MTMPLAGALEWPADAASRAEREGLRGLAVAFREAAAFPDALREPAAELVACASEPCAFAEPWFLDASLRAMAMPGQVRLAEVRREGRMIGLMPLAVERRYGRVPVRHVQNWRHHQQFLGAPLVRAGEERAFWAALIGALDEAPWAPGLFHANALVEQGPLHAGLAAAARAMGRSAAIVHRERRAFLHSDLAPGAYYEANVRKKKRKEIQRLRNRLDELGAVGARRLTRAAEVGPWCDAFLALEKAGWKGRQGSALACAPHTERFFRQAVAGAFDAGRLDFLRLDLDGRAIAMLVNFLAPPGAFSFKTAFDVELARFSPGVLVQLENLELLARPDIAWADSCAAEDHPMIDSLWAERRTIVRVTVRLRGAARGAVWLGCRMLEEASALRRAAAQRIGKGKGS